MGFRQADQVTLENDSVTVLKELADMVDILIEDVGESKLYFRDYQFHSDLMDDIEAIKQKLEELI